MGVACGPLPSHCVPCRLSADGGTAEDYERVMAPEGQLQLQHQVFPPAIRLHHGVENCTASGGVCCSPTVYAQGVSPSHLAE